MIRGKWTPPASAGTSRGADALPLHRIKSPGLDFDDYAVEVSRPAAERHEATRVLGRYLRDVIRRNPDRFRLMGPDETASNRLSAELETTERACGSRHCPTTPTFLRGAGWWRCCPSTCAKAGWRATC